MRERGAAGGTSKLPDRPNFCRTVELRGDCISTRSSYSELHDVDNRLHATPKYGPMSIIRPLHSADN
ncbi:UNVERIFIED_CONTAM: hypothetical protein Sradi_7108000 [Sesamum radiatum]|uniref:Uncharacterized protein n=1 Tax=Sesamum radiatum TaxID=300843 RepID=A0AAW2J0V5_SESRA